MNEMSSVPSWGVPLVAFLIALFAVGFAIVRNWIRRRRAEAELLKLCHGSRDTLERLIAFEQSRTPDQTREEAAKAASYAIRRDNR